MKNNLTYYLLRPLEKSVAAKNSTPYGEVFLSKSGEKLVNQMKIGLKLVSYRKMRS